MLESGLGSVKSFKERLVDRNCPSNNIFKSLTLRFLFEWNFYTNLVFDLICVCYIFGGSILSYAVRLLCKKIYKIIDKFISRIITSICSDISSFSELLGLILDFLKRFANFVVVGIFFLILFTILLSATF